MKQEIIFNGITEEDIYRIVKNALGEHNAKVVNALLLDGTYAYTFAKDDIWYSSKLCKLGRYDIKHVREWLRMCDRWWSDQTVRDDRGMLFKPLNIERTFDRVPNEGLTAWSNCFVGEQMEPFKFHAFEDTPGLTKAYPSDTFLVQELERIDVTQADAGGSIGIDGMTIFVVGNHTIDCPGNNTNLTGTALFDSDDPADDKMGDHSILPTPVPHNQGEDGPGSATVIYPCSA